MAVIYVLENKINNKCYVGQTTNLQERMWAHSRLSRINTVVNRTINKYGWDAFKKYIYYVPESMLDYFEIEMIRKLNTIRPNGYNLTLGGEHGMRGYSHSKETKKRNSETHKGKHHSEETKQKISEANKGENNPMFGRTEKAAPMYGVHRFGENAPHYGMQHSDETKRKMSIARKQYWERRKAVFRVMEILCQ